MIFLKPRRFFCIFSIFFHDRELGQTFLFTSIWYFFHIMKDVSTHNKVLTSSVFLTCWDGKHVESLNLNCKVKLHLFMLSKVPFSVLDAILWRINLPTIKYSLLPYSWHVEMENMLKSKLNCKVKLDLVMLRKVLFSWYENILWHLQEHYLMHMMVVSVLESWWQSHEKSLFYLHMMGCGNQYDGKISFTLIYLSLLISMYI